jgi:hypothetical protein
MIAPGMLHPRYQFNRHIKEMKYELLLKSLEHKRVKHAITLPGLSNFAFERQLIAMDPDIVIECFEKDPKTYDTIKKDFEIPPRVSLHTMPVEQWLKNAPYAFDLIFLDYCSGPSENIDKVLKKRLSPGGIFAVTLYNGRGTCHKMNPEGLSLAIAPLHYDHMYFIGFRNSEQHNEVLSGRLLKKYTREEVIKQSNWTSLITDLLGGQEPPPNYADKVGEAIQKLPLRYVKPLKMRFEADMSYREMSKQFKISIPGAFLRVNASLKMLKASL